MSIRILLADDHVVIRNGLRTLLEAQPDIEIVGEVDDGQEAVKVVAETQPDIVIMDLSMPGLGGVGATRQILAYHPDVKVICLSVHADVQFVEAAIDAGASGYLLKECSLEELLRAVRSVAVDQTYLSSGISGSILEVIKAKRSGTRGPALLTNRELEVLQLIAEGHPTREIANRLKLSVKTIGTYREHLMAKLDVQGVAGLTKYAIRMGLTSVE